MKLSDVITNPVRMKILQFLQAVSLRKFGQIKSILTLIITVLITTLLTVNMRVKLREKATEYTSILMAL
jgi:hypothetical protein